MSDDEMKAELERLRSENAALKKGASRHKDEGQHGAFPGDAVQSPRGIMDWIAMPNFLDMRP